MFKWFWTLFSLSALEPGNWLMNMNFTTSDLHVENNGQWSEAIF